MTKLENDAIIHEHEFFSWKGFSVGFISMAVMLIIQSIASFPNIWGVHAFAYPLYSLFSGLVVGIASGGVLVFLYPPEQDIIGIAGLGSDDASQHVALVLVLLALLQPMLSGFIFFYDFFANDPLIPIWVLLAFLSPSAGLTTALFDRTNAIAKDLENYFQENDRLDMAGLEWLYGLGPRTAAYRMGMLENAAKKVSGLRIMGHEIIREKQE